MNQNTYILRINPGKINKIEENRNENRISIGWSSIGKDLLDANLFRYEFREKIHIHFQYPNYRASGNAAGSLWNFIREMKIGDRVLIPTPGGVYVTVLEGNVEFLRDKINSETAISRKAKWLNSTPYPRTSVLGLLNSRLKVRQTCIQINDLQREVEDLIDHLNSDDPPTFKETLKEKLVTNCLKELREGRLENFGFENLIHKYFW